MKYTPADVDNALLDGVTLIWRECQDRTIWRSEEARLATIRQWTVDFRQAGLPIPE